jgi:glucose/arabinose dehydrogenase
MNAGNLVPQIRLLIFLALLILPTALAFAGPRPGWVIDTQAGRIQVQTLASGLEHPWGLAFLPNGSMLVSERPGQLRVVTKEGWVSEPLAGVPKVFARG